MQPDTYARVARGNGLGLGWARVARAVAEQIPAHLVDRIWLFSPVRREEREWGTAVLACRTDDGRLRIFTASYLLVVRGRERGQGKVTIEEVGESPPDIVHEVLVGVQERAGEPEPPSEITAQEWFPPVEDDDESPDSERGATEAPSSPAERESASDPSREATAT
jgi:hypothetical protein